MAVCEWSWLLELVDECIDFVSTYNVSKRQINVLCFGDSLAKGYANNGIEYYPYSDTLSELITRFVATNNGYTQFGITYSIHVSNVGKNGECISESMHDRLLQILTQSDIEFDVIIINGGSNDIFCGYSADKIWNNGGTKIKDVRAVDFMESISSIQHIYEMIPEHNQKHDVVIVAITIPPFHAATNSMLQHLGIVNERIRDYCKDSTESINQKRMILCDLAKQFPSFEKGSLYWDPDGSHFSERGYVLFGEIVFDSMKDWLLSKISP